MIVFLLLALAILCWPAESGAQWAAAGDSTWGYTLAAEEIRRAGVFRLGAVLPLADGWDVLTLDEYTWRGAPPRSIPFEDDAWTVLVDGLPIDPGVLGVTALERLPLDLAAIDSLTFTEAPRLASGILAERGLLEIRTRRPAPGFSVGGRFATGQETGDPGPFEFVPPGRPNRDRYGHDAGLSAGYAANDGTWYVAAGVGLGLHIASDPTIGPRLAATGSDLRIERTAPSLRAGLNALGGSHTMLAGHSELDDIFRIEAFGGELPARSTLDYAGVTGVVPAQSLALRYRLTAEEAHMRSFAGLVEPRLEFERTILRAELEAHSGGVDRGDYFGLGVIRRDLSTQYALEDNPATVLRTFGSMGWRLGSTLTQRVSFAVEVGVGDVGGGIVLEQRWRPGSHDAISVALSANQPLPKDEDGLYALTAHGFGWLSDAGVPVALEGPDEDYRAASVDAAWERALSKSLSLRVAGFYQALTADRLARRELSFDDERLAWRGPVTLLSGARAQVAGVELSGGGRLSPTLSVYLSHRVRSVLEGGAAARGAWRRLPRQASRVNLTYTPVRGLDLWGGLAYRGGTRWTEYPESEAHIPGTVALDVSIHKELWNGRLRGGLELRNLLNSRTRFHPEGAAVGRAAFLTVETSLPRAGKH